MKRILSIFVQIIFILFSVIILAMGINPIHGIVMNLVHKLVGKAYESDFFLNLQFASLVSIIFYVNFFIVQPAEKTYGWYLVLHPRARRIADRAFSLVHGIGNDLPFYKAVGEYIHLRSKRIAEIDCQSDKDMLLMILNIAYDNLLFSAFKWKDFSSGNVFKDVFDSASLELKKLGIVVDTNTAYREINKTLLFAREIANDPPYEQDNE